MSTRPADASVNRCPSCGAWRHSGVCTTPLPSCAVGFIPVARPHTPAPAVSR